MTRDEADGTVEALAPVLALPTAHRDHTVVTAVERAHTTLSTIKNPGRDIIN